MFSYPIFPKSSAFGAFPAFPTTTWSVSIPTKIGILPVPPPLGGYTLFSIGIPNIGAIPTWIGNIFLWAIGWGGAIFKYAVIYAVAVIVNTVLYILGLGAGLITAIMSTTETMTAPLGIWAIPIDITIAGLLTIAIVIGIWGIIKGIQSIAEEA